MIGWNELSGNVKATVLGVAYAVGAAGLDTAIQYATSGLAVNWGQVGGAALLAGAVYVRGHLAGLTQNLDGTTRYAAPQGSTVVVPPAKTAVVLTEPLTASAIETIVARALASQPQYTVTTSSSARDLPPQPSPLPAPVQPAPPLG